MRRALATAVGSVAALLAFLPPAAGVQGTQYTPDQLKAVMLTPQQAGRAAGVAGMTGDPDQPLSCQRQRGGSFCNVAWRSSAGSAAPTAASVWSFSSAAKATSLLRAAVADTSNYFMEVVSSSGTTVVTQVRGSESGLGSDSVSVFVRRAADVAGATCSRQTSSASMASLVRCARAVTNAQLAAMH